MTTNAQRLAGALAGLGIDRCFGLMGNGNLEVVASLIDDCGVDYLSARHESAAVAAADGYARASGRLGLALVTHGPGLTNAATALVTARRARTPMILVAGDASGYTGRSTQKLDQHRFAAALDVPFFQADGSRDWAQVAAEAAREARASGTVLLNLAAEHLAAPATVATEPSAPVYRTEADFDTDQLSAALAAIAASERPLVLVGRGLRYGERQPEAIALAARLGAPLGTTMAMQGFGAGEPRTIGLVGGLATAESQAACRDCDLVIAIGAGLNGFTTEHATLFPEARVLRLDRDRAAPSSLPVDLHLHGEIEETLTALLSAVPPESRPDWRDPGARIPDHPTNSWPARALSLLDRLLPVTRAVAYDHGDMANEAVRQFRVFAAGQTLFLPDFGSLGLSVAAAIGAAAAAKEPGHVSVAVVGDGGMMMSLPDLDMLARSGLPVLVIVLNDGAYGAELPHLRRIGASERPARFESASLAAVAAALGLQVAEVSAGEADIEARLQQAVDLAKRGPFLLEIQCGQPG